MMWPSPRDFRQGRFKFAGVEDRGLPDDEELLRVLRAGLRGTAMPAWNDLSDGELSAVIDFIKTFSLEGQGFRSERLRATTVAPPSPSPSVTEELLVKGEKLYHSHFECAKCHPAYASPAAFALWGQSPRADAPYQPAPKWSPNYGQVLVPPDFLRHDLKSVRQRNGRLSRIDLHRTISYGLQGPMPGYGHLGAEDVWAVVEYVASLAERRGTDAGRAMADEMRRWGD